MQAQAPPPAQVALAKPPVVPVPAAVVSSPGVTTLPVSVAGISVAIGQPQKAAGAQWGCRAFPGGGPLPGNRLQVVHFSGSLSASRARRV